MRSHRSGVLLGVACLLLATGCDRAPNDLREWTPADHDHTQNPGSGQVEVKPGAQSPLAAHGIDEVTLVTWTQNCTSCHGQVGAGDGPQGPLTRARNLTDPVWQAATSDEAIARAIREGRGTMPGFKLPDSTVQGLVRLVRLLDSSRQTRSAHAADTQTPSAASAAPASSVTASPSDAAAASPAPARSAEPAPSASAR
ncbi:MAG: c-type cytochrome [Pseudomonadota bacterium]|nr:MAG: cytochrome c [Pseudomonadota bacterium]